MGLRHPRGGVPRSGPRGARQRPARHRVLTSRPESAADPIRRYEGPIRGAVAVSLFRRGWVPEESRAAIVVVHGFAEHSGRYEHVGRWLAGRGFAVHAYDQLGHGRSSGARCHVKRFDDYLDDLELVLQRVRDDSDGLPLFLLGHSMGGLVAAKFARERSPDLRGVVLSGPPLGLAPAARRRLWLARVIRRVAPRLRLDAGLDLDGLSTDPRVLEAYLADPLVERKMTAALATELIDAVTSTGPGGADVSLPLLVLHGDDDPICGARFSEAFAAAAPKGRCVTYPGLRHEIMNEPAYEQVLGDLLEWIEGRLAEATRA